MHQLNLEYDKLLALCGALDDIQLATVIRNVTSFCIALTADSDAVIPQSDDRGVDYHTRTICEKVLACSIKHDRRSDVNRKNAQQRWGQQGYRMNKTTYRQLFGKLKKDGLVKNEKYDAEQLYQRLSDDGWMYEGYSITSDADVEELLKFSFPPNYKQQMELFRALDAAAPENAELCDLLRVANRFRGWIHDGDDGARCVMVGKKEYRLEEYAIHIWNNAI